MNPVDTVCAIFLGYHAIVGFARGFVYQFLRLFSWVAGVALSRTYSATLSTRMIEVHPSLDPATARILAWAAILAVVLLASAVALALAKKLLTRLDLSGLDRVAGLAFGALKAALIVVVLAVGGLAVARAFDLEAHLLDYRAFRWSTFLLERSRFALPSELATDLEDGIRRAKERASAPGLPEFPAGGLLPAPR